MDFQASSRQAVRDVVASGHHDHDFPHMWCAPTRSPRRARHDRTRPFFRPPYVEGAAGSESDWNGSVDWRRADRGLRGRFRAVATKKLVAELRPGAWLTRLLMSAGASRIGVRDVAVARTVARYPPVAGAGWSRRTDQGLLGAGTRLTTVS